MLHSFISSAGPKNEQFLPPGPGGGSEQFRVLFIVPLAHDLLQALNADHLV